MNHVCKLLHLYQTTELSPLTAVFIV